MSYRFICEYEGAVITYEIKDGDSALTDMYEHFDQFLKGCGFTLPEDEFDPETETIKAMMAKETPETPF